MYLAFHLVIFVPVVDSRHSIFMDLTQGWYRVDFNPEQRENALSGSVLIAHVLFKWGVVE